MLRIILVLMLLFNITFAKRAVITPNEVYSQVELINYDINRLLDYYDLKYDINDIKKRVIVNTKLKPRNVWQKSYEIMIKINLLRSLNKLPIIEPVNMAPVLNLNPVLVYEQTQRILTELKIFRERLGLKLKQAKIKKYVGKTPLDVFNGLSIVSAQLDVLNKGGVTPSYVFGENMRIYSDLSKILSYLHIQDNTIPADKNKHATPTNTFNTGMLSLDKIKQLQISSGIDFVDFSGFRKLRQTPSEVFSISEMIIAELQTIKAYLGISTITPAAMQYKGKTPVEVDQLMSWNLRKLNLIHSLNIQDEGN